MLTKEQKKKVIENETADLQSSRSVVFIDFAGVKAGDLSAFRKTVKLSGGEFKVVKKKLLRVAFTKAGLDFSPEIFDSQVGAIFSGEETFVMAQLAYKFASAKILGGYDLEGKKFIPAEEVIMLGQLPSREILLGQLVYMISFPIKSFMFALKERALKIA